LSISREAALKKKIDVGIVFIAYQGEPSLTVLFKFIKKCEKVHFED